MNGSHPLPTGTLLLSPGGHFTYRIIGPCCRLFDREQLPWPCCRLQWRGKEPSWRRIGRRFTPDLAAQRAPSYAVEILEPGHTGDPLTLTLYSDRLSPELQGWWYSRRRNSAEMQASPPNTHPAQLTDSAPTSNSIRPPKETEDTEKDTPRLQQCVLPI